MVSIPFLRCVYLRCVRLDPVDGRIGEDPFPLREAVPLYNMTDGSAPARLVTIALLAGGESQLGRLSMDDFENLPLILHHCVLGGR